jgi:hypothetical protein
MTARICFMIGLILGATQLTSCQRGGSFDPKLASAFFPLNEGSSWTYRLINQNPHTTEVFTDRAVGENHANEQRAAGVVVSEYSGRTRLLYIIQDGYVSRISTLGDRAWILFEERKFLPQLLKPGLTWSNSFSPFGELSAAFHIEQKHRTFLEADDVIVPGGHYSGCIRIETDATFESGTSQPKKVKQFRYIDWYAPNVGLVKTLVANSGFFGSEIARLELVSFVRSQGSGSPRFPKHEALRGISVKEESAPAPTLHRNSATNQLEPPSPELNDR